MERRGAAVSEISEEDHVVPNRKMSEHTVYQSLWHMGETELENSQDTDASISEVTHSGSVQEFYSGKNSYIS